MSKGLHREALAIVPPEICPSAPPQPVAAAPGQRKSNSGNSFISILHGLPHLLPSLISPKVLSILQQKPVKLGWGQRPKASPFSFAKTCLCTALSGYSWNPEPAMEPRLGPKAAALHLGWPFLLLWVSSLSYSVSSPASPSPSPVSRVRPSYNLGRTFLGLDKCNACIGTSICKKFFKEEIRSESQLDNSEGQNVVPFM